MNADQCYWYERGLHAGKREAAEAQGYKEALAQPQQEPVAQQGWKLVPVEPTHEIEKAIARARNLKASEIWEDALAAAPQPPQRKPLTDEQMFKIWLTVPAETEDRFAFARAIEAAHGIGDNT
jgi:hypothetical protein